MLTCAISVTSCIKGAGALVGLAAVVGGTAIPSQAAKLDLYINDTLYGVKPGLPFGASLQCVGAPRGLFKLHGGLQR